MATQPNKQHGKPLPMGLEKSGIAVWSLLSDAQQKTAKEYGIFDAEYYHRFCKLLNDPNMKSSLIEKGGLLKGLTHEGAKIWNILDADVQIEVFITSVYGNSENIRKFINAAWDQFKHGNLTHTQIAHGIQTLSGER